MENATDEPVFVEPVQSFDWLADDDRSQAISADGRAVPYGDSYPGRGRRSKPPARFIGSAVAAIDFVLVVASAAFVSFLYVHFSQSTLSAHYVATALIGAVMLVGLFERLGGYQLKQLQSLKFEVAGVAHRARLVDLGVGSAAGGVHRQNFGPIFAQLGAGVVFCYSIAIDCGTSDRAGRVGTATQ